MISNEDDSTDGKSLRDNRGSKGSMCTVRVGSRRFPLYPLVIVCLGLLDIILLLTAVVVGINCGKVGEESTPQQMMAQTLFLEVEQLQIIKDEAIEAQKAAEQAVENVVRNHQQLKQQLKSNKSLYDSSQRQIETLHLEKAMLLSTLSGIEENCGRCPPGWFLLNTSCYLHAKSPSDALRTWTESREDCISHGADLAVIDNWKEQVLLYEHLPGLDHRPLSTRHRAIWIGLIYIHAQNNWVWVNNVTLDEGYWISGHPNDHPQEDSCVAIKSVGNPRRAWSDGDCLTNREWLCEKAPT